MDFTTAVKHVLNNYANFSGRARRSEYWWWTLATVIFQIVANILMGVAASTGSGILTLIISIAVLIIAIGLIVPSIAVAIRRMHDVGRSGWWLLISLIPLIGAIVLIYWFVQRGTVGSNDWGSDPYDA